ncbi:hypothetical protein EXU57_15115 [Segetibacter sp. 3557_3]|uniref:hypothetical protein n=1 Tax=Segetibacter sp. 3557_3 TaxID=2547429 RepID=UPI0010588593|nr:hypothetical protein [Segetibacter sp. 3557_3]TDH24664.1 hypothetical protein EXU57_15115 [Segetibacter sp. 3557_3]
MNRFLLISFQFFNATYHSLIMCKAQSGCTEYRITVMNGDLEKLLFGNNVLKEINGSLHVESTGNDLQGRLKLEIARSLVKMLHIPLTESA